MFLFADIFPALLGEEKSVGLWARQCEAYGFGVGGSSVVNFG